MNTIFTINTNNIDVLNEVVVIYVDYDATNMMGFKLINTGLQIILDKEVPQKISEHFLAIIYPFLEKTI